VEPSEKICTSENEEKSSYWDPFPKYIGSSETDRSRNEPDILLITMRRAWSGGSSLLHAHGIGGMGIVLRLLAVDNVKAG